MHRDELIPLLDDAFSRRPMRRVARAAGPGRRAVLADHGDGRGVRVGRRRGADRAGRRPRARAAATWWPARSGSTAWRRRTPTPAAAARRARRRGPTGPRERSRRVTAADRWREQLAAWAIPEDILANAPESPWGFATECFRRRGEAAPDPEPTPTTRRALEALPEGGTVIDIGVGGGATSLPLAGRAGSIVGIDAQADMLDGFLANAAAAGVEARGVTGTWPDAAAEVEPADVVVAGHVLYNVSGDRAVRPRAGCARAQPRGPRAHREASARLDARPLAAIPRPRTAGRADGGRCASPCSASWGSPSEREERVVAGERVSGGFGRREDAIHSIRKRLCLPADRDAEIADALGDRLREFDGVWDVGPWSGPSSRSGGIPPVVKRPDRRAGLRPTRRRAGTPSTRSRCLGPARRRVAIESRRPSAASSRSGSADLRAGTRRTRRSHGRSSDRSEVWDSVRTMRRPRMPPVTARPECDAICVCAMGKSQSSLPNRRAAPVPAIPPASSTVNRRCPRHRVVQRPPT